MKGLPVPWASVLGRTLAVAAVAISLAATAMFVTYKQAYRAPMAIDYDRQQQCLARHSIGCDSTPPTTLALIAAEQSGETPAFLVFVSVIGVGTWIVLLSYHRPGLASGILGFVFTGLLLLWYGLVDGFMSSFYQAPTQLSVEDGVGVFVLGWTMCALVVCVALSLYRSSVGTVGPPRH